MDKELICSFLSTKWQEKAFILLGSCTPTLSSIWIVSILASLLSVFIVFLINFILRQQHKREAGGPASYSQRLPLPPGPRSWPILGSLPQAILSGSLPHHWFVELGKRYGPLIHLNMGSLSCVVVNNAKMAKEVLDSQDADFAFRPHNVFSDHLSMGYQDMIFRHSTDAGWRHLRKVATSFLFTISAIKKSAPVRQQEVHEMILSLYSSCTVAAAPNPVTVNLREVIYDMNLNLGSLLLYGKKWFTSENATNPDVIACLESLKQVVAQSSKMNIGDLFPALRWLDLQGYERTLRKEISSLRKFQTQRIAEHRQNMMQQQQQRQQPPSGQENCTDYLNDKMEQKDLIDVMLSLKGEESLSDSAMCGVLIDLIFGTTDTITFAIEWALLELMDHPEMLRRAQQEIDCVVGRDRLLQESDVIDLPYLQAIIKETLRMHPALPLGIPHQNLRGAAQVAGFTIPAASIVLVNLWAIGRDPHEWSNPNEFDPQRFVGSDVQPLGHHFQLIPFSTGRRKCPGYPLALAQVPHILASLLQAFDLRLPDHVHVSHRDEVKGSLASYTTTPLEATLSCRLPHALYK